jgi:hypothetical protein
MVEKPEDQDLSLSHQGDHHMAKVAYDPESNKINAGAIANFSDHASAGLQFVDGKLQGSIIHSGDNHSLQLDAKGDGTFEGTYREEKSNLEIAFKGGIATLVKGQIPEGGIKISGDHHVVNITKSADGKLSGGIESQATDGSSFKIGITNGKLEGGFTHKGTGHETSVTLSGSSLKAAVSIGTGDSKFTLAIEKGRGEVKGFGGIKFKF